MTCQKCIAGVGEELVLVLELSVVLGAEALAVAGVVKRLATPKAS